MTDTLTINRAEAFHQHARGCKKVIDNCLLCQKGIEWFASLPLNVLSNVLSERPKLASREQQES